MKYFHFYEPCSQKVNCELLNCMAIQFLSDIIAVRGAYWTRMKTSLRLVA